MKRFLTSGGIIVLLLVVSSLVLTHHATKKTQTIPSQEYVALGDSVAAGVGLETYTDSSACDRTSEAYPSLVGSSLTMQSINIACSGATMQNGILGKQDVNQLFLTPQLNQLYKVPKEPTLITLTVGANDIGWTDYLTKCYSGSCGSDSDTAAISANLGQLSTNLNTFFSSIQSHYNTKLPRVILTSYYKVFPQSTENCSDLSGINSSEISWANTQQNRLDATLSQVVSSYTFVKFAQTNFSGHELCSSNPWVQGLTNAAPYHPNDSGQAAIANQITSVYKSFK